MVIAQALIAESARNHDNRRSSTCIRADPHVKAAGQKSLQIAHFHTFIAEVGDSWTAAGSGSRKI
jgi:hypothetical protein